MSLSSPLGTPTIHFIALLQFFEIRTMVQAARSPSFVRLTVKNNAWAREMTSQLERVLTAVVEHASGAQVCVLNAGF